MLFSGTLRVNLDPFDTHTDQELWSALESAHLSTFVSGLEKGLQHKVAEGEGILRSVSQSIHRVTNLCVYVLLLTTLTKHTVLVSVSWCVWLEPSSVRPRSWCWMRPQLPWTWRLMTSFRRPSEQSLQTALSSPSHTDSTPSWTMTSACLNKPCVLVVKNVCVFKETSGQPLYSFTLQGNGSGLWSYC